MVPLLNILLIATLLVIGICIWQVGKIVKKEKISDEVDPREVKKLERFLNVIHICVSGIGVTGARRICQARRHTTLGFDDLKRMGIVLKRAMYFITCSGRMMYRINFNEDAITRNLLAIHERLPKEVSESISGYKQLSLFDTSVEEQWRIPLPSLQEVVL